MNAEMHTVTRTYRAAIRIGEDYITLEETVTLPLDATDDAIAQTVALGLRIYQAQHAAVTAQASAIRAAGPAATPASEKQRTYIGTLFTQLAWSDADRAAYLAERQVDWVTLTKAQASSLIEDLRPVAAAPAAPAASTPPATPDEARRRFYDRYGATIGGTTWDAVQTFLRRPRHVEPATVDGWLGLARAVRDHAR